MKSISLARLSTILFIGLSIYYYVALADFSPEDPSPFSISLPPTSFANITGSLGALISAISLFYLGLASIVVPIIFAPIFLCWGQSFLRFLKLQMISVGFLILLTSSVSSVEPYFFYREYPIASGGLLGTTTINLVQPLIGPFGLLLGWILIFAGILTLIPNLIQSWAKSTNDNSKGTETDSVEDP